MHRSEIIPFVRGDYYTEGPAVDGEGNIFFTTLTGGTIMKCDAHGMARVWARSACPNGQRILSDGDHLVCDSKLGAVIRFAANGRQREVAASGTVAGVAVSTPNDLAVHEGAGFYFTDSVRHTGAVFFVGDDGFRAVVAKDLDYPNGICLSADRSKLFVAESYKNQILVIDLDGPGSPKAGPRVFCPLPWHPVNKLTGNLPDGIALDANNRLWVAHYGMGAVHMISPDGVLLATHATGIPLTSNLYRIHNAGEWIVTGGSGEPGPGMVHRLVLHTTES